MFIKSLVVLVVTFLPLYSCSNRWPQNSFNATMDPSKDMPGESTCTSCQFTEDFSNYWTAVLYFRAQNGSYKRVPQLGNNQFKTANGGLTIYYMQVSVTTQRIRPVDLRLT